MSTVRPVRFVRTPSPEDALRADLYGLLSRLFYSGPDAELLGQIAAATGLIAASDSPLSRTWTALCDAANQLDAEAARLEYEQVFIGVGKAPVSIYAAHYLTGGFKEQTLVNLRDELQGLGLARRADAVEPEDHLAALLDVMRHLILRGEEDADVAAQTSFFVSYLKPWYVEFVAQVNKTEATAFYRAVAQFLKAYFDLEVESFEWTV